MTQPLKPQPGMRKRILLVLAISVVIFLLIDSSGWLDFDSSLQGLGDEQKLQRMRYLFMALFFPLFPFGLYIAHFGYRIIQTGQFPPPGTRVIKTTQVETGRRAMFRGWVGVVAGLSLCVLSLYGGLIIPTELQRLLGT